MIETVLRRAVELAETYDPEHQDTVFQAVLLAHHLNDDNSQAWIKHYENTYQPIANQALLQPLAAKEPAVRRLLKLWEEAPPESTPPPPPKQLQQRPYIPRSQGKRIGMLVPVNMATATERILSQLEKAVRNVDAYVQEQLGYESLEELWQALSAEQIDAVALAIRNLEFGSGFINGDETGAGKGRFNAAMARYAARRGWSSLFVTKSADLYADYIRDLEAIGLHRFELLPTNAPLNLPLPDGRTLKTTSKLEHDALLKTVMERGLEQHDGIVTTYFQLQTVQGKEPNRREFLRWAIPKSLVVFDESHLAGGSFKSWEKSQVPDRAGFARELVDRARGVIYSSATYAKDPSVLILYAATDIARGLDSPEWLIPLLRRGGVPLQQSVAGMLVQAGQYIRRERSFEGVDVLTEIVPIDPDIADLMAIALQAILEFDFFKEEVKVAFNERLKAQAKALKVDTATGQVGASSISFASLLHNVIGQYLLAVNAELAVQIALEEMRHDRKPVIAVSNTMGSFLGKYVDDMGIAADDFIDLSFQDLLLRYLRRSRVLLIQDYTGITSHHYITDEELRQIGGKQAIECYELAENIIRSLDFGRLPISPIDWLYYRLKQEGKRVGEITGREHCLEYINPGQGFYRRRHTRERGNAAKVRVRSRFNSGELDVLIINRSGSTGISLHSSVDFLDQRQRTMILMQFEQDINEFAQVLGRVRRTGEVIPPRYIMVAPDTPAAKRPLFVLLKKLVSLNANTIAARDSMIKIEGAIDLMNELGDRAIETVLDCYPGLDKSLGFPLGNFYAAGPGDIVRRVTGRIPLLKLADQETIYQLIEEEYQVVLEQAKACGDNPLEADLLDLQAKPIHKSVLIPAAGSDSPFTGPIYKEDMDCRVLFNAVSQLEAINLVRSVLGLKRVNTVSRHNREEFNQLAVEWANRTFQEARSEAIEYSNERRPTPPDDNATPSAKRERQAKIDKFDSELLAQFSKIQKLLKDYPIGSTVRLTLPNGEIRHGVVKRILRKNVENPVALYGWSMEFLVTGTEGNLAPIRFQFINTGDEEYAYRLTATATTYDQEDVYVSFDRYRRTQRETRTILTGNLLTAFDMFGELGQLISFTNHQGEVSQGLLLRKHASLEKAVESLPSKIPAEMIQTYLAQGGVAWTKDNLLSVTKSGTLYTLTTPGSAQKGGRYFKDETLLELAKSQFYLMGERMVMEVQSSHLDVVLKYLGQLYAVGEDKRLTGSTN